MIKTTVKIDGMSCGMCESHVNDTIRNRFPVKKVNSSYKKGIAEILSQEGISEEKLKEALDPTGYRVLSVSNEEYKKKGLFGF